MKRILILSVFIMITANCSYCSSGFYPATRGDNLGNHTATKGLDMSSYPVVNVSTGYIFNSLYISSSATDGIILRNSDISQIHTNYGLSVSSMISMKENSPSHNNILDMFTDSLGKLWLAFYGSFLHIGNPSTAGGIDMGANYMRVYGRTTTDGLSVLTGSTNINSDMFTLGETTFTAIGGRITASTTTISVLAVSDGAIFGNSNPDSKNPAAYIQSEGLNLLGNGFYCSSGGYPSTYRYCLPSSMSNFHSLNLGWAVSSPIDGALFVRDYNFTGNYLVKVSSNDDSFMFGINKNTGYAETRGIQFADGSVMLSTSGFGGSGSGGSYWVGTATSPLNMSSYGIYGASSVIIISNASPSSYSLRVSSQNGNNILGVRGDGFIAIGNNNYGVFTATGSWWVREITLSSSGIHSNDWNHIYETDSGDIAIHHNSPSSSDGTAFYIRTNYAQLSPLGTLTESALLLNRVDSFAELGLGNSNATGITYGKSGIHSQHNSVETHTSSVTILGTSGLWLSTASYSGQYTRIKPVGGIEFNDSASGNTVLQTNTALYLQGSNALYLNASGGNVYINPASGYKLIVSTNIVSNGNRNIIDLYDGAIAISTPYALTQFSASSWTLISPLRQYNITISTIVGAIQASAGASINFTIVSASCPVTGTISNIVKGVNITSPNTRFGTTPASLSVPKNYGLWLVINSISGNIDRLNICYSFSKD